MVRWMTEFFVGITLIVLFGFIMVLILLVFAYLLDLISNRNKDTVGLEDDTSNYNNIVYDVYDTKDD